MLLRLKMGLPQRQLDAVLAEARRFGYECSFLDDGRQLLALDGTPGKPEHRSRFEDLVGVAAVLDPGDARERHERAPGQTDHVVRVGSAVFGGGVASLIAGPCAVEDTERVIEIAKRVRDEGATLLRGGAYKPRTSPYSFQGLGRAGLEMLRAVRAEVGIGVVTEVMDPREVEATCEVADMLQIGARSMACSPLLLEVGKAGKPVLLKRGFGATVREFLLAAEYLLSTGNENIVLCERGVRSFDSGVTRNLLDVGAVAHLKRATHLPVVVDPSHAAGRADLVRPLARAGIVAGADGLIVEVHPRPAESHSDGAQAISVDELRHVASDMAALLEFDGRCFATQDLERASA